ncbi:MAG: Transcriptional regulator, MarR family [Myxococcaceae bacterium]|nr:Transcriptional regulator, MarR family [Myxococcaceae bacterium]
MVVDRRLIFVLQRASRAALRRANELTMDALGVSAVQLATLAYLAKRPRSTMTELANLFDLNKSAVSGMIARLERAGLVERAADPRDGRANLVSLTAKGLGVYSNSVPLIRRAIAELTEGFTPAELEVVFRFLNSVIERYADSDDAG